MSNKKLAAGAQVREENKGKTLLKSIGSVLFAIVATAHHWLHMLLIALGLTTIGASLFSMPPTLKMILLLVSLVVSIRFIVVAKRKWNHDRSVAWVYAISSIISIVLVFSAIPQTINGIFQKPANMQDSNMNMKNMDMKNMNMQDHNNMNKK